MSDGPAQPARAVKAALMESLARHPGFLEPPSGLTLVEYLNWDPLADTTRPAGTLREEVERVCREQAGTTELEFEFSFDRNTRTVHVEVTGWPEAVERIRTKEEE